MWVATKMSLDIILITNSSFPVYFGYAGLKPNPIKILEEEFLNCFCMACTATNQEKKTEHFSNREGKTPFPHYDIDQSKNKYVH